MKIGFTALLVAAVGLATVPAQAESIREASHRALAAYEFTTSQIGEYQQQQPPERPGGMTQGSIYEFETRSPKRAFLYSLLIPGAGQLYAGNKIKAAAFFLADVVAWGAYFSYRSSGHDKEDEYRAFADAHWNSQKYWDSLLSVHGIPEWGDGAVYPHHLPYEVNGTDTVVLKSGEYYENVGKYDQFVWGWDDLEQFTTGLDPAEKNFQSHANRDTYVRMREDANKQFDHAAVAAIVSIANHLISAFDAALTAHRFNRSAERAQKLDIDLKLVNVKDSPTPWVNVAYKF